MVDHVKMNIQPEQVKWFMFWEAEEDGNMELKVEL